MHDVAEVNGCRYCSFVHQEWVGASETAVWDADAATALAVAYAQTVAEQEFAPVTGPLSDAVDEEFSPMERKDLEVIARVMTVVNVSLSTLDALESRCRGRPATGSRLRDEVVITLVLVAVGLPAVAAVALLLRRSPVSFVREILAHAQAAEA